MPILASEEIASLLAPYLQAPLATQVLEQVGAYLDLLVHWNERTNLTAVRDPRELVQRQIGESLFAAELIGPKGSLLDFGSGAGFPGIPMQLLHPELRVTLAESRGKKAAFLREAVRSLGLPCRVWSQRVEALPAAETFDVVAMRAVDKTEAMLPVARARLIEGGKLLRFLPEVGSDATGPEFHRIPLSRGVVSLS